MLETQPLRIYRRYGALMYRLAFAITGSQATASEAVIQACREASSSSDALPDWPALLCRTRAAALRHARHQNDASPPPEPPHDDDELPPFVGSQIRDAYEDLDEADRSLLWTMLLTPLHGPAPVSALGRAMERFQAVLANQSIPDGEAPDEWE